MGQFVHEHPGRVARDHRVGVQLMEGAAPVFEGFERHLFEPLHLFRGGRAAVGLHEADHHVFAAGNASVGLGEHAVGLTNPGYRSEKDL